jgi:hypothetical protein
MKPGACARRILGERLFPVAALLAFVDLGGGGVPLAGPAERWRDGLMNRC